MKISNLFPFPEGAWLLAIALFPAFSSFAADSGPEFHHDFAEAAEAAKVAGKPLLVVFSASWCPPCQQMKSKVYPSGPVQPYHDQFVWAYLDTDEEKNRPLASKFGVSGIPHIAFLRQDATMMGHFTGAISPEKFTEVLDKVLVDSRKPKSPEGE
ncbi:MAG: thioredoxin family protein [Verrucomicrobiales bacterium]|nr:thioredoxin family protein [Verrucomicrobiales bacterium]